jgi:hypothetical protein
MDNKKNVLAVLIMSIGAVMLAVPMIAHHGTGISYDGDHPVTLKGTMVEFRYVNPHPQLFFDVTEDSGKVTRWAGEVAPTPFTLQQNGWNKSRAMTALAPGTKITITLGPSRAGTPVGVVQKILNDQGEELLGGNPTANRGE